MKQTALQQVIELINTSSLGETPSGRTCAALLKTYLPVEREQITDAFTAGHNDGASDPENLHCGTPSEYFTQNYTP